MRLEWYPLRLLFRRRVIFISLVISALLVIASWALLFWGIPQHETSLFLHYTVLFGVDKIGARSQIYATPLFGLIILVVNVVVTWLTYAREAFMAEVIIISTVVIELATLFASLLLVFLNS